MTEPESHTLACRRRIEKLDRLGSELCTEVSELRTEVGQRLERIEDELLVLNGIALRLEGREMETTGLKAILDGHERWPGELGRRITELEGAPKE